MTREHVLRWCNHRRSDPMLIDTVDVSMVCLYIKLRTGKTVSHQDVVSSIRMHGAVEIVGYLDSMQSWLVSHFDIKIKAGSRVTSSLDPNHSDSYTINSFY